MPKDTNSKQITAIRGLRNNHKITIKRADKGGSVVIMNTNDYITKALDHLNQPKVYQEVATIIHHGELYPPNSQGSAAPQDQGSQPGARDHIFLDY